MEYLKILKLSPSDTRKQLANLPNSQFDKLTKLQHEFAQAQEQLKALKQRKNETSGQFKKVSDQNQLTELKNSMKELSKEIAVWSETQKTLVNNAQLLLEDKTTPDRTRPKQFNLPELTFEHPFTINEEQPTDSELETFFERHADGNQYQRPVIFKVIKTQFGHDTIWLCARANGTILGILPITIMKSRLFGSFGVSTPYFNYGGPLSHYQNITTQLIQAADTLRAKYSLSKIEIRTTLPDLPFPSDTRKASMVRRLPASKAELEQELGTKVRAQCKKATEHQPVFKFGHQELVDDFYRVFAENMRDLGTPVYPKQWFSRLICQPEMKSHIIVCYLNKKPVAAAFLIGVNDMLEIPWASCLRRANPMNMNMWMYRQILDFAIEQGYQFFDFGRSSKDASTYRFKKQWGPEPIQHYWYTLNGSNIADSGLNPDNPKFKLLIAIWQRLPVWLANLIGPRIIGDIP
ncbi:MAG: FemAB family PEP-CTERM system-associated protein [Reinekea sp.]|nr:FemAB family PEP-CTERM system-associated protein [Reinekea sp.]